MTCVGQERAYGTRTLKIRDGRISDLRVSCSRVRFWLQADQLAQPRFVRSGLIADIGGAAADVGSGASKNEARPSHYVRS